MSGSRYRKYLTGASAAAALLLGNPSAFAAEPQRTAQADTAAPVEEIVVTARRRAENVQRVPVAVTVLSGQALEEAGIKNFTDLGAHVPGANFTSSGGVFNTVFSLRGESRSIIGNLQPAIGTYVNEVVLPYFGANIPTYDVSNVQVLKGPQGTLFGRNTTAGAILVTTNQPSYNFGGYLEGTFGDYAWHQFTGAVNIPIVKGKVALRLAGQIARRDGYTKNFDFPGRDFDDIHRDQGRVSLLVEPAEGLKNVTVYDWMQSHAAGAGAVLTDFTPLLSGGQAAFLGLLVGDDIAGGFARALAAGPRTAFTNFDPFEKGVLTLLTNTTTWDLGGVTLKNIFGYRTVKYKQLVNVDGIDVPLVDSLALFDQHQWTDEFQASGKALNNRLDWVVGVFYLDFRPGGPETVSLQQVAIPGTPFNSANFTPVDFSSLAGLPAGSLVLTPNGGAQGPEDFFYDKSRAAYGQIGYDLGGLWKALDGLKVDLGYRFTEDKEKTCSIPGQSVANGVVTPEQCLSQQPFPTFIGFPASGTIASQKSYANTYTIGLNYQATDNLFLYAVHRRGYRSGGLNTPVFGGTLTPFQSFKPETVQDVEIGFKSAWAYEGWRGIFNFAAYSSWYQNTITGITVSANPNPDGDGNPLNNPSNTQFLANVGKSRVSGIEIDGSITPMAGLDITYGATWLDKVITDLQFTPPPGLPSAQALGTPEGVAAAVFLGAPKYTYSAGVRYVLPLSDDIGKVVFNASHYITSSMFFGSVTAKTWNKTDFRIDWNDIYGSPIDAGLFVTNAFDTTGIIGGSLTSAGFGLSSAFYNEPRMFGGTIRYHFGAE